MQSWEAVHLFKLVKHCKIYQTLGSQYSKWNEILMVYKDMEKLCFMPKS